jgi:hypothetical protein
MLRIILTTCVALLVPASAFADGEAAIEPGPPGSASAPRGYVCQTIKGNAELERAATETPPPYGPEGQRLAPRSGPSACPAGMLGVTTARSGARKTRRAFMSGESLGGSAASPASEKKSSEEGYFYVGDIWETAKIGDMLYKSQFSSPVIPTTAAKGAHTISQLALVGGGKGQYSIEMGWTKELKDQEEGYKGARPFFFVNPDNYGPLSCYDCGLVLAEGVTENPFEKHYHSTDGSPESECAGGIKPCSVAEPFWVKQYKGAWWLFFNNPPSGQWVGRVSDAMWGKHFLTGNEEQVYGEVFDTPNAPTTPMGNGNKGGCTCATEAYAPRVGFNATAKEPEPVLVQETFHNPILNVSWPQRYTSGNFNGGRTTYHFGG